MGNIVFVIYRPARQVLAAGMRTVVTGGGGTGAVDSVNGQTGTVVLDTDDIAEGATNLYYTDARAEAAAPVQSVDGQTGAVDLSSVYTPAAHVGAGGTAHADAVAAGAAGFMTGADKSKLDGIEAGAEVNVPTDLSLGTITTTTILLNSSSGADVTLPAATTSLAGLQSAADKTKLDGVATGATANSSDATLLARANHTGTQAASTISDFASASRAQTEAELIAGTNITITPAGSGATRTLTIAASGGGGGATLPVVQALSSTRNLVLADINTFNVNSTGTDYTATIQPQSAVTWTADAEIHFLPTSTGNIVITAGAGVSLNGVVAGSITLSTQYGAASIKRVGPDSWWLGGVAGQTGASGDWCAAGGTANTYTLTPVAARESYVTGDQFRARFSVTNTGATTVNVSGLGTKTCVTVTGAALPAGYIRTDADTVLSYDGTNFVVQREDECSSNANGYYLRKACGAMFVWGVKNYTSVSMSGAVGALFRNAASDLAITLPAAFAGGVSGFVATFVPGGAAFQTMNLVGTQQVENETTSEIRPIVVSATSGSLSFTGTFTAQGKWY